MTIKFHNTLTGKKEEFEPIEEGKVKFYCCGPTVYDYFHIGNARPFIVFDALRSYLEFRGFEVTFAQNVTDLDDKIINKASEEGKRPEEIASKFTEAYYQDMEDLGIKKADIRPKVTDRIDEIKDFVKGLVEKGYAYEVDGDVYFRVEEFEDYGKLSGRTLEELRSGERVDVNEKKENPLDFTLWKAAKKGEPSWESPWGEGRPGWHIECSVMVTSSLGETIDIHSGGQDLIFPHHENEIAQAEALKGEKFARYWLHNGLLQFEGEKMSKSLDNFEYARDVLEDYGKETVRYFYLSTHYRKPLDFSKKGLDDAKRAVERVYNTLSEIEENYTEYEPREEEELEEDEREFLEFLDSARSRFVENVDDDFNTPGGLGVIFDVLNEVNGFREKAEEDSGVVRKAAELIRELGEPLGLFQKEESEDIIGLEEEMMDILVDVRSSLRKKEEWELADEIRDRLNNLGIKLKDGEEGTNWRKAK